MKDSTTLAFMGINLEVYQNYDVITNNIIDHD